MGVETHDGLRVAMLRDAKMPGNHQMQSMAKTIETTLDPVIRGTKMANIPKIQYAKVQDLHFDPTNPRLGRRVVSSKLTQEEILDAMTDWSLDELATSFIESGFWPQEALIVVKEKLGRSNKLIVVEGNRRLAALKLLKNAVDGKPFSARWEELVRGAKITQKFFEEIPVIEVKDRSEVSAYLGFRHVSGIKEWKPAEKAEYIAKLIEGEGLSYEQVRRKIGSKAPVVRQHYIAYRLLLQMDAQAEIAMDYVEVKFSVLYLSLRTAGVQSYLGLNLLAEPATARKPVKTKNIPRLVNYARWLFGTDKVPPLFSDSRSVDQFGRVLESEEAVQYLERTPNPRFDVAKRKSGASQADVVSYVNSASDSIQLALTEAHVFKKSPDIAKAVKRLAVDAMQLISIFPSIQKEMIKELKDDAGAA